MSRSESQHNPPGVVIGIVGRRGGHRRASRAAAASSVFCHPCIYLAFGKQELRVQVQLFFRDEFPTKYTCTRVLLQIKDTSPLDSFMRLTRMEWICKAPNELVGKPHPYL